MDFYDLLETRDAEKRETALFEALPRFLEEARSRAPALERRLAGVRSADVSSRAALARVPVLRKSDLGELQRTSPPFGGLATLTPGEAGHVFGSPGPLYEPAGRGADYGGFARALFAA